MDAEEVTVLFASALVIVAGLAVIWMAMQSRRQIREMEHRERLAMIERGIPPGVPLDIPQFTSRPNMVVQTPVSASRARTGGVTMISLGLAFMFMLGFTAGEPGVGIGIGGAFALVGAGFYINSILIGRDALRNARAPQVDVSSIRRDPPRTPDI